MTNTEKTGMEVAVESEVHPWIERSSDTGSLRARNHFSPQSIVSLKLL
jgi:hypothetical protein